MPSSALLYILLFFWTLPAVALISFYVYVLVRGRGAWKQPTRFSFLASSSTAPMRLVREATRTAFAYHRPTGDFPIIEQPPGLQGEKNVRSRQRDATNHLHVPLVIEDADGNLHMRSWHIYLN